MTIGGQRERNVKDARIGLGPVLVALGALVAALPLGCGAEVRPAAGQLMVAVSSDMLPGRDFDDVRVIVSDPRVSGEIVRGWRWGDGGTGARLPGTVAVVGIPDGSGAVTSVRVEGWQRGVLRVVREARVRVPEQGRALLRTPVEWSCLDVLPERLAPRDAVRTCRDGETCVGGRCVPIDEESAVTLPTYTDALVFGGGAPDGAGGACFDVLGTFASARVYVPENVTGACGITRPSDGADVNVAVALGPGGAGYCAPDACLVPLDRDAPGGWRRAGARLVVPEAVCDRGARVAVAAGAPSKTESVPPCSEWSSVGVGSGTSAQPIVLVPSGADASAPDASVQDASVQDASVQDGAVGPVSDASAVDASATDASVQDASNGPTADASGARDTGVTDAGCVSESDATFCQRLGAQCGPVSAQDNCGRLRTLPTCGPCAGIGQTCGGAGFPNQCGCAPESEATFCARNQRECGALTGADNCGTTRTASSCGTCAAGQACGAGGVLGRCACAPESDVTFCARYGRCGATSGVDNCGVTRSGVACACSATEACNASSFCDVASPALSLRGITAGMSGDGISNCGAGSDHCASSTVVPAGAFGFGSGTQTQASVASVLVDRHEVTVGRFRAFVAAWLNGWRPAAGAGKHAHLASGQGLAGIGGGFEVGWQSAWNDYVGAPSVFAEAPSAPGAVTAPAWDAALTCDSGGFTPAVNTWTSTAGANERLPQNCLSWYDAYAFCVWDGGFLPSVAEWEFVAAGGAQERRYPWGEPAPAVDRASYGCLFGGGTGAANCVGLASLATAGSLPLGRGRWGHMELAGNVAEWTFDGYASRPASCSNCAELTTAGGRIVRGGAYGSGPPSLEAVGADSRILPAFRGPDTGTRCARTP
jgi:formylglycine-generating enzyme required for sulfatase activity